MTIRVIEEGETALAAAALLELRPHHGDTAALTRAADALRATGYELVGSFDDGDRDPDAAAVAGFRVTETLVTARRIYVDDLVTRETARGRGHATALLAWLDDEARRRGCTQLYLDSGVIPERRAAHRRYFGHGMRIASYNFQKDL